MSTKDRIFELLAGNRGQFLSGEEIGSALGVSRAAVWKGIKALRQEGFPIEAATNKGYWLANDRDYLSAESIRQLLSPGARETEVLVFDTVESTNRTAKEAALREPDRPMAFIANHQTAGRGRLGRSFYSPEESGLYMSLLFRPADRKVAPVLVTTAASVAVLRAVEALSSLRLSIKWVNDLYLGDKKICGILTEAVSDLESGRISYLVLGIGVNCFDTAFPDDLADSAGSLGAGFSRNQLAAEILNQWFLLEKDLHSRDFLREYKDRSMLLGKEILVYPGGVQSMPTSAMALDIDGSGGLVVAYLEGPKAGVRETLSSGEVSVRLGNRSKF